jgi:cellulose synthase/poly-beta-1,6-N-acetylglucosamine synthase-like glycosyltransferase
LDQMTVFSILYSIAFAIGGLCAVVLLAGVGELLLVSFGALLPMRRPNRTAPKKISVAVVVPAHNEEAGIAACVESIRAAVDASAHPAQCFVVADNCSDNTAALAHGAGASVLERHHDCDRGKGYALAYAFAQLLEQGWDAFLVVDADTLVSPNLVDECAGFISTGVEAVQARYLVRNPDEGPRTRLLNVALLACNHIRPKGRERLGLSCGLYGNGFALSRAVVKRIPYHAFSIVEDLEYHLRLVLAGARVRYAENATVWGTMPEKGPGTNSQRARWEGGRLAAARCYTLPLIGQILRGRLRAFEPLLELLCVPLAYYSAAWLLLAVVSASTESAYLGGLALLIGSVLLAHVSLAIASAPDPLKALQGLTAVPIYIAWKMAILPRTVRQANAGAEWIRTERSL